MGDFHTFVSPIVRLLYIWAVPTVGNLQLYELRENDKSPSNVGGGECRGLELTESLLQKLQTHFTLACVAGGFVGARELIQHPARQQNPPATQANFT